MRIICADLIGASWIKSVFHINKYESHLSGSKGREYSTFDVEYVKLGLLILSCTFQHITVAVYVSCCVTQTVKQKEGLELQ